jgi:hypothetical protein
MHTVRRLAASCLPLPSFDITHPTAVLRVCMAHCARPVCMCACLPPCKRSWTLRPAARHAVRRSSRFVRFVLMPFFLVRSLPVSHGSLLLCLPNLSPALLPAATLPLAAGIAAAPAQPAAAARHSVLFFVFPPSCARRIAGRGAQLTIGTWAILQDPLDISCERPPASQCHRPCGGGERGRDVWARAPQQRARGPCRERERHRVSFLLVFRSLCLSPVPYHPPLPRGHRGFACALFVFPCHSFERKHNNVPVACTACRQSISES